MPSFLRYAFFCLFATINTPGNMFVVGLVNNRLCFRKNTVIASSSSDHSASTRSPLQEIQKSLITLALSIAYTYQPVLATEISPVQQGMALFRNGDVKGSIVAFDRATAINPKLSAFMWQRGLSLYYAEEYQKGSEQFRYDIAANPSDAEEIIWTVMCESKLRGYDNALQNMPLLPVADRRPIMRAAYELFQGKADEKVLANLGDKSGRQNSGGDYFYSRLYLSLYREAKADSEASKEFMREAVTSYYGLNSNDYMTSVARIHLASR
jgi:tetratricopeptide (TPR) repeat protein